MSMIEELVKIWKQSNTEFQDEIQKFLNELEFGNNYHY